MDDWYTDSGTADGQGQASGANAGFRGPGSGGSAGGYGVGGQSSTVVPGGLASSFHTGGALSGSGGRGYGGSGNFTPPSSGHDQGYGQPLGGAIHVGGVAAGPVGGYGGGVGVGGGGGAAAGFEDYSNEPPLLEELGINFEHIWSKTMSVIVPTKSIDITYLDDTDLAGPLVFCLIFGACLLFTGKVHFGYIYGFGLFGCVATTLVLNLLSPGDKPIDVWKTCSVLGYCLLPVIGLAALNVVMDLRGAAGLALAASAVLWCSFAATRLFEQYLAMRPQRWLVAYPVALLYTCFVLITIF